jgi:hypothetical protein
MHTTKRRCAQALAHNAEDHGDLVDDELCPAEVVLLVPHVAVLELAPLHLLHVEAPYYCHGVLGVKNVSS